MAKALARANKLMTRSGANRPGASVRIARRSVWTLVTGFLMVCALFAGYTIYLKLTAARTAELSRVATNPPKPTPTPEPMRQVTPTPSPTAVPRDPVMEEAFGKLVLNGFRNDPPRVLMGGKLYSIGSELLPGLMLKEILDGRTVVVEDNAGAIYRRTF